MDLPIKILLINQQTYKGLLKLDTILYADNILLSLELFNFKTQLTNVLIESFNTYISNREFLKTLPIEKAFEYKFTLTQAEEYYQYLLSVYEYSKNTDYLTAIDINNLRLWLDNVQIFSIICFFQGFILSYNNLKINISIFREQQVQKQLINKIQPEQYIPDSEPAMNSPVDNAQQQIIIDDFPTVLETDSVFLNDILKLSPSNMVTYFISKYIHNMLSYENIDTIEKAIDERGNITISMQPLISFDYLKITEKGIYNFIDILSSFEFTINEYINKIKTLLKGLIYISNRDNINDFTLSLKTIEILIFIYTLKSDVNQVNAILNSEQNINNIMISIITNNTIEYVLNNSGEFQCAKVFKISFFHPTVSKYNNNTINENEIRNILNKEMYLLEIDKMQFLQTALNKVQTNKKKGDVKLILDSESIINIDEILSNTQIIKNKHLNYKLLKVSEKQFEKNRIITPEYYSILKIGSTMFKNIQSNSEEDLIMSKYYSNIEQCLKQISNVESNILLISTLNILYQFIRPNIEANVQIELYILYRIIIPFIYDVFNINNFKDYFN